jgi:hypothetical protein
MKKMISHQVLGALVLTAALAFTSCQKDENEMIYSFTDPANVITSDGGVLSSLDGNVVLAFPAGAIDFTEHFTVNVCQGTDNCPYLLHPISIEPFFLTFKKPVELSIKTNACLMNDPSISCSGMCVSAFRWNSPQDFLEQVPGQCSNCVLNDMSNTVDLVIYQTGVFAVGLKK